MRLGGQVHASQHLSDQERKLMEVWDKQDPIDEWEIEKNKRINKIK